MKKKEILIIGVLAGAVILLASSSLEIVSAKYDVNGDGEIDGQDCTIDWAHRTDNGHSTYEEKYDMNDDSSVDGQDATIIWSNRGNEPDENTGIDVIIDWISEVIWG